MVTIPLSQVNTLEEATRFLGCTVADLHEIESAEDQRCFYTRLQIPKKSRKRFGQFRTVYKADQRLGLIQKNIANWISDKVKFQECVQGFVQKRSIVTNARLHLGQRVLIHADIKSFFESITTQRVEDAFHALGCKSSVSKTLARVCTLNGMLPQGSSASPILANLVCRHLDTDLETLAVANKCRYSRYADDITISGDHPPKPEEIEAILARHGFSFNAEKCRIQRRGRRQYVTGLTVVDQSCPRVPRVMKRRLRLELYYAERYGIADHLEHIGSQNTPEAEATRLKGWMSFIYSVEGTALQSMYEQWLRVENRVDGE
jgi:RNA-directed DNA polymerase